MHAEIHLTHPRTLLGAALAVLSSMNDPRDSQRAHWLRDPAMGHYKACAEFRMGRYAQAREVWAVLVEAGHGEALLHLGILAEEGLGEPRNPAKAKALYARAAQASQAAAYSCADESKTSRTPDSTGIRL